MILFPALAALIASLGWATGAVLAQPPARALGTFEFTRIQLLACSAIVAAGCTGLGLWGSVAWGHWPAFAASIVIGILLGNLAMIECLRLGGPRRMELLLSLKAPVVGLLAFAWLGEVPNTPDLIGAALALCGVALAILYGSNARSASDQTHGRMAMIVLLGLLATGFQGVGFLIVKPAMLDGTPPLAITAIRLLGAAFLISLVALWPSPAFRSHRPLTPTLLARTVLPGFIGYVVSSSLLLYAMSVMDAGIASVLGSLSPVLVLPIIWIKEGVAPRSPALLGAGLAVAGSAMIVLI
ncbi:DMT family transporter [Nioella aestuarii]|uniref:DMT family transporter n=1 Tax=Nioella aestuarii TaxID=1662864 RepID=UPI003D7FF932